MSDVPLYDIDLAARPSLERLFLSLDPTRLERVIVDIRQVTFFDSTGLNMAHRLDRPTRSLPPEG